MKLSGALFYIVVCSYTSYSNTAFTWMKKNLSVFPEATYDADYKIFAHKKNEAFEEAYSNEFNFNINLAFLEVKNRFYWMFEGEIRAGLGQSQYGMVLHPYDVNYAIIPSLEYRLKALHISSGLDHRCFHYIDQKPPEPIVYWNKIYLSVNSPHRRARPLGNEFINPETWSGFNRCIWRFAWGYYISDFFGLVSTEKLMSVKRPHYLHDFRLEARYGVVRWKWGAALLTGASLIGFKKDGSTYWAQETGTEVLFITPHFDTSVFVNYIRDKGLFNSKDQLLEFGLKVVK